MTGDRGAHAINLRWLVRLRWGAALGQSAVILLARWAFGLELPLVALFAVIAVELASNVACAWLFERAGEWLLALVMAFDVALLTALLHLSGGSFNPFNFLYLVHIALAAVVLRPAYTWGLVALSLGCFASLFGGFLGLPQHVHHAEQMEMHLRGMWLAFAVAAVFIVYFVGRIRRALSERDAELEESRKKAARSEKLASLATLAAGAAHELATPLGTIAVATGEMQDALARDDKRSVEEDAALIRAQVQRCRAILDQMAAGDAPGEALERVTLVDLAESVAKAMGGHGAIEVNLDGAAELAVQVPRRATEQALRGLVKNACDASGGGRVVLGGGSADGELWLEVKDQGSGMTPDVLARAAEPFFTTKDPGSGMGLGLFLAHALAEQLGGRLDIDSTPARGTTVRFVLPRR